jgi:Protein of unknown function (DUF3375)
MQFDASTLEELRTTHPAWRLLRYERAPLTLAFLHHAFVRPNARAVSEDTAIELLDDLLYALRSEEPDSARASKSAREYLMEWAGDDRGFVRRYYPLGSEEPHFAVTPGAERAIVWLESLGQSGFVGTESRLRTAIELLRQLDIGTHGDVDIHLEDLHRRRSAIDEEIALVEAGDMRLLDDRSVAERFQQFLSLGRELLADFRQVEENFRALDRNVRERIAQWDGSKGELLGEVFGERDLITASDQGASFRAFWEVLSSVSSQDELTERLGRVLALEPITALGADRRIRRIHHDWFNAGDHTQRTVAGLTAQLRRFIDDKTWLENRRIIEILRTIEQHAIAIRDQPPATRFMSIASFAAEIALPMERRLANPLNATSISVDLLVDPLDADLTALFADSGIDTKVLADQVDDLLVDHSQISLAEVCIAHPLVAGLAELLAYLQLRDDRFQRAFLNDFRDRISWQPTDEGGPSTRVVHMPRVVFVRG